MTYFFIRISCFFVTFSLAQVVTHTEKFDDGGLKSITYYKKIGNKTTLDKEENLRRREVYGTVVNLKERSIKKIGNT